MANTAFGQWWEENIYEPGRQVLNEIGTGLQNWWYKNTGQAHLTSEYQHEEELANTAYQRAAEDMQKAGLSKFGGVNPASSPSPKSGQGLLATALAGQQLKGQILSNKENSHNLKIAKKWNIPTSATGEVAKYDAISKFLFGKGIMDMVGDDGLMGLLKGFFSGSGKPGEPDVEPSGSVAGAAADAVQAVSTDSAPILEPVYSSIFGDSDVFKPAPFELPTLIDNPYTKELDLVPFSETHFETPSTEANFAKILGGSVTKDVDVMMKKMLNDNMLSDDQMYRVASGMAKRYNVKVDDILVYMHAWIAANDGEVVARWK